MGYYIEVPVNQGKAKYLIDNHGAEEIEAPPIFVHGPDEVLICVVENKLFDAAGIIYDEREWRAFNYPDARPRTWLVMSRAAVLALNPTADEVI